MRLGRWSLACYRLAYEREVRWADGVEAAGVFALLRLESADGAVGIAEATLKPTWSGVSPRSLAVTLEDVLVPRLAGADLGDAGAVSERLRAIPDNWLAKGMLETAAWTLRAAVLGAPLWKLWGGEPRVELSWTLTRQAPRAMAAEAAAMTGRFGFGYLKMKGGQGLATDLEALAEIRAAVGGRVALCVDANATYAREQAAEYVARIAEAGAVLAEDPCPLVADAEFEKLQRDAPIPILVDADCVAREHAERYLDRGARALSAKPGRSGLTESREIARVARDAGAAAVIGLYAESALGTLINLQQAAALPPGERAAPAELTFFLGMREQVLADPLDVRAGALTLPASADLAQLVDWDRVRRYAL